jgi:coproporphyrinogen III oxidase
MAPTYYERFKKWADDYFYIPHRKVHRGVGGIFYDHLECDDDAAVRCPLRLHPRGGRGLSRYLPKIVRRGWAWNGARPKSSAALEWRGRYAEFNLVYDRGTLFGLKTGGNVDAILMSLPPLATWS